MKRRLLFIVDRPGKPDMAPLLNERFVEDSLTICDELPSNAEDFDIGVIWNYRKLIEGTEQFTNLVVFHASALPQDRGWAPIYHTFANERRKFTLTAMRPTDGVDAGAILAQATFEMKSVYTAPVIRVWIAEIAAGMIDQLSLNGRLQSMKGLTQTKGGNFNRRRRPSDCQLDPSMPLTHLLPRIRGCEAAHPAMIDTPDGNLVIEVRPEQAPEFPNVTTTYYD